MAEISSLLTLQGQLALLTLIGFFLARKGIIVLAPWGVFCPNTALPPWAAAICCTTYKPRIWGAFSAGFLIL